MNELSISLFGTPQIKRGIEQISIQRRKDLALLIYLVVTSRAQSRDTLANLLWPDLSQADARSNLRKSLSRLKLQLGEEYLLITQLQVGLSPEIPVYLDVAQFESRMHWFRSHGHQSPLLCEECQKTLEEAVKLYNSDFLSGFTVPDSSSFEEWHFFQSESLRKSLAEILEQLTHRYTYLEDFTAAIHYCRRWLALDPFHEPSHRQLMLLYALSGQPAAAVRQFEECALLLKKELDALPEPETLQLYEDIKKRKVLHFKKPVPNDQTAQVSNTEVQTATTVYNLPAHPAPFIGRAKELREMGRILAEPSCRLLTLLGPGGNGKTRLAAQFALTILDKNELTFKDGIWFIPLAPLVEGQSIVGALNDSFRISGYTKGEDARQKLLSHVQGRQLLLVLDNFEHLLHDQNVQIIIDILHAAPQTRLLVTSRERLNIEGETIFRVEGLEIPTGDAPQALPEAFSALQLFEQCARRVQPSFILSENNYDVIAGICRQVQGMPLAIELAASWLELLSPSEINREIARSLDFLESSRRDLPDRQRSARAVFDSSWTLLNRQTRPIVKALSIFRTSFTRDAAQTVSGASAKALLELTNKSWLHRLSDGRYQIHELLRQFAYEKLSQETASLGQVKKQFCDYYASYTNSLWERVKGADQRQAYLGAQAEFENIQTAWLWLVSENKLETAVQTMLPMLLHFCEHWEKVTELRTLISAGLKAIQQHKQGAARDRLEVILRTAEGAFHYDGFPLRLATYDGVFPIDEETSRRAWILSRDLKFHELGFWGILLAYIHGRLVDLTEGVETLTQMLPHFREGNKSWELAITYLHISRLLILRGEISAEEEEALTGYLSEARNIFSALGDHINTGYILSQWGELRSQKNDMQGAIQEWTAARTSLLAQGEWATANDILWQVCDAYLQLGSFQKAFDSCHELAQVYFDHGLRQYAVTALSKESFEKVRYGDLSDALRLRQQCLDITQEIGPVYQFGWSYWEMGEIMRVQDRLEDALDWYQRAHSIFEKYNDYAGTAFYYRGMGDIALATCDYQAAYSAFSRSQQLAQRARHTWSLTYVVTGLARAKLGLNELEAAAEYLEHAIRLAWKSKDKGISLVMILVLADFFACRGDLLKAVELGSLVKHHISSWHETRKRAAHFLASLKKSMTDEEFDQAQKRGRLMDIWETVKRYAAEPL